MKTVYTLETVAQATGTQGYTSNLNRPGIMDEGQGIEGEGSVRMYVTELSSRK